jgi:hypothetical protein
VQYQIALPDCDNPGSAFVSTAIPAAPAGPMEPKVIQTATIHTDDLFAQYS